MRKLKNTLLTIVLSPLVLPVYISHMRRARQESSAKMETVATYTPPQFDVELWRKRNEEFREIYTPIYASRIAAGTADDFDRDAYTKLTDASYWKMPGETGHDRPAFAGEITGEDHIIRSVN